MSYNKKWNERYLQSLSVSVVHETLKKFIGLAPKGRALDIACGLGQNSIYMAECGFVVDAVDFSHVAISKINHPKIHPICNDINLFPFPQKKYSLILCSNFLERNIFEKIEYSLKEEGILIYTTFNEKKRDFNPDFLLKQNELLYAFLDLEILYYEAIEERSTLVAKKSATL